MKEEILKLKQERNAIILAHNYQSEEVQAVADIVGDSLALSKAAANAKEDVIVFCGVHFMAETAKILSPEKTVLLPVLDAGCPMADMVTAEALKEKKKMYPEATVVCYVNSSAQVKAESDICCTSANAVEVVKNIPGKQILFVPDQNLGNYVAKQLPEKEIIVWDGYCITHHRVLKDEVVRVREAKPNTKILIHPECQSDVLEMADFVGSTSQIIDFVNCSEESEFIIGTEMGILTALKKDNPDKKFYMLSPKLVCVNMKKTRLEHVRDVLKYNTNDIQVDETIRTRASKTLANMQK